MQSGLPSPILPEHNKKERRGKKQTREGTRRVLVQRLPRRARHTAVHQSLYSRGLCLPRVGWFVYLWIFFLLLMPLLAPFTSIPLMMLMMLMIVGHPARCWWRGTVYFFRDDNVRLCSSLCALVITWMRRKGHSQRLACISFHFTLATRRGCWQNAMCYLNRPEENVLCCHH